MHRACIRWSRSPATCVSSHASAVPQKYQSHEIVQLLEELGLDFGACSNAYTSADETVRLQFERAKYWVSMYDVQCIEQERTGAAVHAFVSVWPGLW